MRQHHRSRAPSPALLAILAACAVVAPSPRLLAQGPPAAPGGLTLSVLLDSVRKAHPAIHASRARVRVAEGTRSTAGRLGNPVLTYQMENVSFPRGGAVAGIDRETMAMAMLPLEPFYQRGARVSQAQAMVRAAEAESEFDIQRTALDAARAFYRTALANVIATTNRDLVAWLDSVVTYNGARVREGAAAESDLIRSTLERDRATADAAMADAELAQARAQLASYLGVPSAAAAPTVSAGETLLDHGGAPGINPLRQDVRAARERVAAASAGVTSERRSIIREVGATLGSKQMMGTTSMIVGLSVPLPLFNQNSGEIARASAERDVAINEAANQERMASAELIGAEETARLLTERASALTRGGPDSFLSRAEESRRIALAAYREGAVPLLQVIDAARVWGDARVTYFRTLYAQHESVLAHIVARGGDLFSTTHAPAAAAPNR